MVNFKTVYREIKNWKAGHWKNSWSKNVKSGKWNFGKFLNKTVDRQNGKLQIREMENQENGRSGEWKISQSENKIVEKWEIGKSKTVVVDVLHTTSKSGPTPNAVTQQFYNWSIKVKRRKSTGIGRMRRHRNGFREGTQAQTILSIVFF